MNPEIIPRELRERHQWLVWRYEEVPSKDKPTKVPYRALRPAVHGSSTNRASWARFDEALQTYESYDGIDGIGYALARDDPYTGVDLDHCRDPESGEIDAWARDVIARLDSYTEVSPSQSGVRIFISAILPPGRRKHGDLEVYEWGRYLTVTGDHVPGTPLVINERTAELAAWHREAFPPEVKAEMRTRAVRAPLEIVDAELIARAKSARNGSKFAQLWAGDISGYRSASEADLALCSLLAFWTGGDENRIDVLFRQSGLHRADKWDSRRGQTTYGAITVALAAQTKTEFWSPPSPPLIMSQPATDTPADAEPAQVQGDFPQTDLGNAQRLVTRYGHALRFCHTWNKWLAWDGGRWHVDDTGAIVRCAKATVRAIYQEAADADDADAAKSLAKHALRSQAEARIRAMISLAESEPSIPVTPDALDANPWLLCVRDGTLDLRTGLLREHRREDLITKIVPVSYDPAASCPTWNGFLAHIMAGKADLIEFLQRASGYSLTGDTRERALFFLHGVGRNGKSTFIEAIRTLLGDYAIRTPTETLLAKNDGGIPNDVARLKGARYVSASEAEEGKRLAEALVKSLTGGDTVSARFMRGEWFDFRPEFKLWLATNHKPVIRGTDHGIWDRIRLIPFEVRIPEGQEDKDLPSKLAAELPGILAWSVRGCMEWQRDGLGTPREVRMATAGYRAEMDILGGFLEDCCALKDGAQTSAKDLYGAYRIWCDGNGERVATQHAFGRRLAERGLHNVRRSTGVEWVGIELVNLLASVNLHEPYFHIDSNEIKSRETIREKATQRFIFEKGSPGGPAA